MIQTFTGASSDPNQQNDKGFAAGETDATIPGFRSIAINVLGAVGYGTPRSWRQENPKAPPGYELSYMEAILAVVENLVPATFVPVKILTSPVMPKGVQRIGFAVSEFPRHVKELLQRERESQSPSRTNLTSTIIKVSQNEETAVTSKTRPSLSENELAGNLFQFTVAGFDTTANSMAYAITMLAIYPEWQEWVREELREKLPSSGELRYEDTYPKLTRCLALMVS